nr:MAG TPA: hypothetical protein [Bacteriophage sp.]DAZ34770.1 MAG TPA: hypothetical protein [Caudoviricetes sp.]
MLKTFIGGFAMSENIALYNNMIVQNNYHINESAQFTPS